MLSRTRSQNRTRSQRGQATAEFALVSIVFFFLVFGIIDGARLFESWVTLQHAAREGARYAITGQVDCAGYAGDREACITEKAMAATEGLSGGGLGGADVAVTFVAWEYPDYTNPPVDDSAGDQCDAIEVRVTYTHEFAFPLLKAIAPSGVDMTGSQRMINEPFGPCIVE